MSNCLKAWLGERQQYLSRQLLVIDKSVNTIGCICEHFQETLLLSEDSTLCNNATHGLPKQFKQHLGLEYQSVIVDCTGGLLPNVIFAAAGLVCAPGLLVLITPHPADWPKYFAMNTALSFSYSDSHPFSFFAESLRDTLETNESVAWYASWQKSIPSSEYKKDQLIHQLSIVRSTGKSSVPTLSNRYDSPSSNSAIKLSEDQKKVLSSIQNSWQVEKNSFHFISGNRGRGKTTLLSQVCWLASRYAKPGLFKQIFVCAPTRAQRQTITSRMSDENSSQIRISLIAPDQVQQLNRESLLIIDEAASIAPYLLTQLCEIPDHVVLAATTQGYEGSGKGLVYRWLPSLEHSVQFHTLKAPFRWQHGDALEKLIDEIFEPSVESPEKRFHKCQVSCSPILTKLNKGELKHHPSLNKKVMALLQNAHYQNTPNDLLRIFDAQDHQLWIYSDQSDSFNPNRLIGLVCTIQEGSFYNECASELRVGIANGKRRVQGHMSIQAFASGLADPAILNSQIHRIHRIAVWPDLQGNGYGSDMLKQLENILETSTQGNLSSSLGLTPNLFKFWQRNGYALCRLGQRKDTSSGTLTGHFLHRNAPLLANYKESFNAHLNLDLHYLEQYNHELLRLIPKQATEYIQNTYDHVAVTKLAEKKCNLFSDTISSYTMSRAALYFVLREEALHNTLPLFDKLHQKHLSKQEKQACILSIKNNLLSKHT